MLQSNDKFDLRGGSYLRGLSLMPTNARPSAEAEILQNYDVPMGAANCILLTNNPNLTFLLGSPPRGSDQRPGREMTPILSRVTSDGVTALWSREDSPLGYFANKGTSVSPDGSLIAILLTKPTDYERFTDPKGGSGESELWFVRPTNSEFCGRERIVIPNTPDFDCAAIALDDKGEKLIAVATDRGKLIVSKIVVPKQSSNSKLEIESRTSFEHAFFHEIRAVSYLDSGRVRIVMAESHDAEAGNFRKDVAIGIYDLIPKVQDFIPLATIKLSNNFVGPVALARDGKTVAINRLPGDGAHFSVIELFTITGPESKDGYFRSGEIKPANYSSPITISPDSKRIAGYLEGFGNTQGVLVYQVP